MAGIKKERIFTTIKFIFPLFLSIVAIFEIKKFAKGVNIDLLQQEVSHLHIGILVLILIITLISTFPMFFYDFMLTRILGIALPRKELLEYSFIANSFSNLIGFGGLIGAMLRTYFYHDFEYDKRKLVVGITSVSLFYLTGISLFSWVVTIAYRHFFLFEKAHWLYFAVLAVGFYLPVFSLVHFINAKKDKHSLITLNAGIKLVCVSILEWFFVFFTILSLSYLIGISVGIRNLIPVFMIASCAGIISMIPGGLGSFDLIFIWGMHNLHVPSEKVIVLLLFYRLGYYVLPFLISAVLFIRSFWMKWNKAWSNLPNVILQGISHVILTLLVFASGLILLLSASVPGIMSRMKYAQTLLSFPIMNLSHQLSVAAGFLLLGLSRGIEYSVKRTYELTVTVLIFAALFSIFKGIEYEEAIFLLIVAILLRLAKGQFYRESYIMTWGKTIFDVTLVLVITSMYLIIGYSNLPSAKKLLPSKLEQYAIVDSHDLFYSAIIGLLIAFIILMFGYLISNPKKWDMEKSVYHEEEIVKHLKLYKGKHLSNLIFLHDKFVFWNKKKNVLIFYQPYADKLVVLGDPIGEKNDISSTIEEFQEIADIHGFTPVFYQVSDEMLSYLHVGGYAFFKLGEEVLIDLSSFTFSEQKPGALPTPFGKCIEEGYLFSIVKPPHSKELLKELREVSDEWLEGDREKIFSYGFFDEDYLNKTEIAIIKDQNSAIVGFANILPGYEDQRTASVDLMRILSQAPPEITEFLFLSLLNWAKENGYLRFNLGMIPLANSSLSRFSFLSEKIAAQIFLNHHFTYNNTTRLNMFTQNHQKYWEPKFLAYRRKSSLPFTMMQISLLISKKRA
jgi:phosphatidylglycerol lysyltransferase